MISLLHATARLPDGWRPAMEAFLRNATNPQDVEYILGIDEHQDWSLPPNEPLRWASFTVVRQNVKSPVTAYNEGAAASRGDILITISDDYFPPAGWDDEIRRAIPDVNERLVLDVENSDGVAKLLPFSILTRAYYDQYGYIFYPKYHGLFADNEFTAQAKRDRVIRSARHIVFQHLHPDRGQVPMDEIYARQKSHMAEGKAIFKERKAKGFPKWPD